MSHLWVHILQYVLLWSPSAQLLIHVILQLTHKAPKVRQQSSTSECGNVWLYWNNGGQLWQSCSENFYCFIYSEEQTHLHRAQGCNIWGWKVNVLLKAKYTGSIHRRLGSTRDRMQHSKRTIYSFHFLLCITEERACGVLYENRAWPNVAWRPWWIHIDGKAASEAQQPWFFHKPSGTRSQSADRC